MSQDQLQLNLTRGASLALGGLIFGAGAYTGRWGQIASLSSAGALSLSALDHIHTHGRPSAREEECSEHTFSSLNDTLLKGILAGSMAASLIPLSQAVLQGVSWQNRAFLAQLALPALTLGTGAYTLWNKPKDEEETCWMETVEKAACFLTSALATAGIAYVAASPSPVMGLLTLGVTIWYGVRAYQDRNSSDVENLTDRARPSTLGIAAAASLALAGLIGDRYARGVLFTNMNGKLVTLGQGALLTAALAVFAGAGCDALTKQGEPT